MPEMLSATSALMGVGYKKVVLITDGRFSGGTRGPCIGHVHRKRQSEGRSVCKRGDSIAVDLFTKTIDLRIDGELLRPGKPHRNR